MQTSNRTIRWIENLAEQEISITAGEQTSIDICSTRDDVLLIETVSFARDLFRHFNYLVGLFNERVGISLLQIKLARGGVYPDDFSLSRHGIQLLLTFLQPGSVHLQCVRKTTDEGYDGKNSVLFSGLIEAKFAHFHHVEWSFLASPITAEQVACHYLTEFVQMSQARS